MKQLITITLRPDDAEPILREAAFDAAKFSALHDHITERTVQAPRSYFGNKTLRDHRQEWLAKFLRAKRIVEAFGIEYERTSEAETLTIYHPPKKNTGTKYVPDYSNPLPCYRREIHQQACSAAADRAVQTWRKSLKQSSEAA